MTGRRRIFLSPPWTGDEERAAVSAAFDSGYVAPCGPMVDEFERALARLSGRRFAVALSSGTAALDLVMAHLGVDSTWTVVAPTLTFIATVGPAWHRGAKLVLVDSDATGSIDTALLARALEARAVKGRTLVVSVDLYGRPCDGAAVAALCRRHGALYVSDSAEAVGATGADGRPVGSDALAAVYSFNGNKIVTTSGGGAVVTDSERLANHVRKLSQQSREDRPWYEHREVGFNSRMSNLLGAVGLAQLGKLPEILARRAATARFYAGLGAFEPLPPVRGENHWLTVGLFPSKRRRDEAMRRFAAEDIEVRPVWKPMHLQPVFKNPRVYVVGGAVAEDLFERGMCLPSGTGLTDEDLARIAACLV